MAKPPVSVTEDELWGYFEKGPAEVDEVGGLVFRVVRGPYTVAFGLNREFHDVSIGIARDGASVFELVALSVPDVRWRGDGARERLEVVMGEKHSVFLEINPAVAVVHHWGIEVRI
jgi:hypothetical protein